MTSLPAVRHVALLPCRGEASPALHLHFEQPLKPHHQAIILGDLAAYILKEEGETFEPDFGDDVVSLQPAAKHGRLSELRYVALLRHFGLELTGDLPFIGHGQCPAENENHDGEVRHVPTIPAIMH